VPIRELSDDEVQLNELRALCEIAWTKKKIRTSSTARSSSTDSRVDCRRRARM